MNKKFIISLGLVVAISATTISAMADSTIYTDGIGRMHFLGRDAKSNTNAGYNYTNSAEQDLTRRLYEQSANGVNNDTSYNQHPLKNYENTFPDSRFGTSNVWKTKYANNADDATVKAKDTVKATATATKGTIDASNPYAYGNTNIENGETNIIKSTAKKHWWNRNK